MNEGASTTGNHEPAEDVPGDLAEITIIPYRLWTVAEVVAAPDGTVMLGRPEGVPPQPRERTIPDLGDSDACAVGTLWEPSPSLEARLRGLMDTHGGLLLRDNLSKIYGGHLDGDGLALTVTARSAVRSIHAGYTILKLEGLYLYWWAPATGDTWNTGMRVIPF